MRDMIILTLFLILILRCIYLQKKADKAKKEFNEVNQVNVELLHAGITLEEEHNKLVDEANKDVDAYNELLVRYNKLLKEHIELQRRHVQMTELAKLGIMGVTQEVKKDEK